MVAFGMLPFSRTEIVSAAIIFLVVGVVGWAWLRPDATDIAAPPLRTPEQLARTLAEAEFETIPSLSVHDAALLESVEIVKRNSRPILKAEPTLDPRDAFAELDADRTGTLSEAEFVVHFLAEEQGQRRPIAIVAAIDGVARAKAKFSLDDEDRDGQLSEAEFGAGKFRIDLGPLVKREP